jgi:hypothetical protein
MVSLRSYLHFPSEAPYAWFVYSLLYIFLAILVENIPPQGLIERLFENTTPLQQMQIMDKTYDVAINIWHILIVVPLIQIVRNIGMVLFKKSSITVKSVIVTVILVGLLYIVAQVISALILPIRGGGVNLEQIIQKSITVENFNI